MGIWLAILAAVGSAAFAVLVFGQQSSILLYSRFFGSVWVVLMTTVVAGLLNSDAKGFVFIVLLMSQAWVTVIKLRHSTVEPLHSPDPSHQICHAGVIDMCSLVCYRQLNRSKPPLRQHPVTNCNWVSDNTLQAPPLTSRVLRATP